MKKSGGLLPLILVAGGLALFSFHNYQQDQQINELEHKTAIIVKELRQKIDDMEAQQHEDQAALDKYGKVILMIKDDFEKSLENVQNKAKIGNQIDESIDKMIDGTKKKAVSVLQNLSKIIDEGDKNEH